MEKLMVLYNASVSAREQMAQATPEQAKAGTEAWMQWSAEAGDALVGLGAPMQAVGRLGGSASSASGSLASGYSILQSDSREQLEALLENHPHLKMPDSSIEVFQLLPVPGS